MKNHLDRSIELSTLRNVIGETQTIRIPNVKYIQGIEPNNERIKSFPG